jgi:hypothetical protein
MLVNPLEVALIQIAGPLNWLASELLNVIHPNNDPLPP